MSCAVEVISHAAHGHGRRMLSISQKETILRKAGYRVAPFPERPLPLQQRYLERNVSVPREEVEADHAHAAAVGEWRRKIERDYALHIAQRHAEPSPVRQALAR